jgi:hypothetical protein
LKIAAGLRACALIGAYGNAPPAMALPPMLRAPKHLRAYIRYRQRAIEDRVAHRARAILFVSIIAGLIVLIAVVGLVRHFPA